MLTPEPLAILIAVPPKAMSVASKYLHGTSRNLFAYQPLKQPWSHLGTGHHSETSVCWYPYNTYTEKREELYPSYS